MQVRRLLAALLLVGSVPTLSWAGQTCTPGLKSCDGTPKADMPRQQMYRTKSAVNTTNATPCSLPGTWSLPTGMEDGGDMIIEIKPDLTGTLTHPYCAMPHTVMATLTGIDSFVLDASYPPDPVCVGAVMNLAHAADCVTASGTGFNKHMPDLLFEVTLNRVSSSGVFPGKVSVPANARVEFWDWQKKKFLLTESAVATTIINHGNPAVGLSVSLQSNRPTKDTIVGPSAPTNSQGTTLARIQTRDQIEPSVITVAAPTSASGYNAQIDWLPAEYELPFQITCYVIAEERLNPSTSKISAPGLPVGSPTYNRAFLADVALQGSGQLNDGRYIRYSLETGQYSYEKCALTASGECAVEGRTVAVDPTYVPFRSTINIDGLGERKALDTGGRILHAHIDEFYGFRREECFIWGSSHYRTVQVLNQPWRKQ